MKIQKIAACFSAVAIAVTSLSVSAFADTVKPKSKTFTVKFDKNGISDTYIVTGSAKNDVTQVVVDCDLKEGKPLSADATAFYDYSYPYYRYKDNGVTRLELEKPEGVEYALDSWGSSSYSKNLVVLPDAKLPADMLAEIKSWLLSKGISSEYAAACVEMLDTNFTIKDKTFKELTSTSKKAEEPEVPDEDKALVEELSFAILACNTMCTSVIMSECGINEFTEDSLANDSLFTRSEMARLYDKEGKCSVTEFLDKCVELSKSEDEAIKRKVENRVWTFAFMSFASAVMPSQTVLTCSDDKPLEVRFETTNPNDEFKVTFTGEDIKVEQKKIVSSDNTFILKEGETMKLTKYSDSKFTSSNKDVATVSKSGKITAKKRGKATITETRGDKEYQYAVEVERALTLSSSKDYALLKSKPSNAIKFSPIDLKVGKTLKMECGRFFDDSVGLYSSNKKVVAVSKDGIITAKKKGTAIIYVQTDSRAYAYTIRVS